MSNRTDKRNTYAIVQGAIREKGIETVRKIVYNTVEMEGIGIEMFVNSRMFRDEIIKKLES